MSSLTAEPSSERSGTRRAGGVPQRALARLATHPDAAVTVALAALLLAVVFVARGYTGTSDFGRTTLTEIGVTLLGTAAVAYAALVAPAGRRLWGGVTVLLLAALTALVALSIVWSIQPADSWNEANLALSYFAAFAGAAALVRAAPARWRALLGAVVIAAVVASGYSLLAKVYPSLSQSDVYARLRAPFDYWNAVGLMAVLGIPGCLWLGARRDGHAALGALAVPALGLLLATVVLSVGRGALLTLALVLILWFAAVPLRLRGIAVLATAGAGAAVICAWTFANPALTKDGVPQDLQANAGHDLGLLLLAMLVVLLGAGLALSFALARSNLTFVGRRRIGAVLLVLLALVPVAAVGALATSSRGLTGTISHGWTQLTDPNAQVPSNSPGRLSSAGSVRARYYDDAITIWKRARWTGVGADGYATARRAIQTSQLRVSHAHGYVAQTLADLGVVGLGLNALVLVAWLVAAARAAGMARPRWLRWLRWLRWPARWAIPGPWRGGDGDAGATRDTPTVVLPAASAAAPAAGARGLGDASERIGLITLAITALAFGLHSAIDWTWYIPGTTLVACIAAGWVAGRGPLAEPPSAAVFPRSWRVAPTRLALAATVVVAGLAAAWMIEQPQRAANVTDRALAELDDGHVAQARADAELAARINPLSIEPLSGLAQVQEAANEPAAARTTLERAVELQPANPEPWLELGQFELRQNRRRAALEALNAAVYLAPHSAIVQGAYAAAQRQAAGG